MSDYDDIPQGSNMPHGDDMPPADAEGLDRPSDNEDALNDQAEEFNDAADDDDDDAKLDDSDDESLLSEVDEAQFAEFDPATVDIAPDFETLRSGPKIGKRKRDDDGDRPAKKKERTRERARRRRGAEDGEGAEMSTTTGTSAGRKRAAPVEIPDENLAPEDRRRRALDRAMDAAVKKSQSRKGRKGEIDLEAAADEEINSIRNEMVSAAMADSNLVSEGKPAFQKLKMLPQVVSLLNRNTLTEHILDPENNLLEAVRFFLEPLVDGSLPAYNIQRELFQALERLPMTKEALISSGIGKVVFFYRRSKRVDPKIKRLATKLMEEWSRPILQRSDDFTKKAWETVAFDPNRRREDAGAGAALAGVRKEGKKLAPGAKVDNRARRMPGVTSYTVVPQVNILPRR